MGARPPTKDTIMDRSQLVSTVAFDRPGKQHGHLCVPYSYNLGGWANLLIPITVVSNGPGRTALVMAGNHGDEYPGQVAILKLMRELAPEQARGRIILIPTLNQPAARAATRLSPLDGKNLNRCFPGRADGTVTEMIAHYVTTVLFPLADIVIDIHTGGRSTESL
jgi:N-alpha-acetyl-L-2,4-diaminobutyrate deacetylase